MNLNFTILNSSFSVASASAAALSASTVAIAARVTVLEAYQSTTSVNQAGLNQSTTTLSASTAAIQLSLDLFKSTAGPLISTLGGSTASVYAALQSTAGALTAETAARVAADALKQDLDADLTDLADGSLTASKVAAGYDATGLSGAAPTATALAANPAACGAGDFVNDMAADGTLTCGTPAGGGETNTYGTDGSSKTFINDLQVSTGNVRLGNQLRVGTAGSLSGDLPLSRIWTVGLASERASVTVISTGANTSGGQITFFKSRTVSDTGDADTVVANGDSVGGIEWWGADGAAYRRGASIYGAVNGIPGSSDMPMDLNFYTVPDGSASSVLRMVINSTGIVTAVTASSAPIVYVSSINAGDGGFLNVCGETGACVIRADAAGATTGVRFNGKSLSDAISYPLEVVSDPASEDTVIGFRRNDTSISAGDSLGGAVWRDNDSSTGGSSIKSAIKSVAQGVWSSGGTMETQFEFGLSRGGSATTNYMVLTSSGLNVYGVVLSSTLAPSIACDAGTGVVGATATNQHGSFVAGAAATNCTITFSRAYPKVPTCVAGEATSLVAVRVSAASTTAITIAGSTISGDTIYYICMGAP